VIIGVGLPEPVILVAGVAVIVGCGCAGMAVILGMRPRSGGSRRRTIPLIEHEKDVAAALRSVLVSPSSVWSSDSRHRSGS
jgi:hypothetical protein